VDRLLVLFPLLLIALGWPGWPPAAQPGWWPAAVARR
jgi:hypothetical protein